MWSIANRALFPNMLPYMRNTSIPIDRDNQKVGVAVAKCASTIIVIY